MTALCGFAGSYAQLFLARVGVSVGKAGGTPSAVSYLSDIFCPERRAAALAAFTIGGPAGAILATIVGGGLAEDHGCRAAFFALGAVGLVLANVVRPALREVRKPIAAAALRVGDVLADQEHLLVGLHRLGKSEFDAL